MRLLPAAVPATLLALALAAGGPCAGDDAPAPQAPPAPLPAPPPAPEAAQPAPAARAASTGPSRLTAELRAVRVGEEGPLGEHDFRLTLVLANPGEAEAKIAFGHLLLRTAGGWLSPLDPPGLAGTFAKDVVVAPGGTQRVEPSEAYKVLGPAHEAVVALSASDGPALFCCPIRGADEPGPQACALPGWPLGLGALGPLEAVPYGDGHRSIVVVGQVQLLGPGVLSDVQGSVLVGSDAGTSAPITWSGGTGEGVGPALWPFVQRLDVGSDFTAGEVSVRLRARLDGAPVQAELQLPAHAVEPFLCQGPLLGTWMLGNGPAERQVHANLLQLRSRYAWDFVQYVDGSTYQGDPTRNASYHAWDKEIRAVADGEVVDLCTHQVDRSGMAPAGSPCVYTPVNRVVLRHDDGTYTAYLHIQQGKGPKGLAKGSRVKAGEYIAKVGNSGDSSEPHLHFFAFRIDPATRALRPVPVAFTNAFHDAKATQPVVGVPVGGQELSLVQPRRPATPSPR